MWNNSNNPAVHDRPIEGSPPRKTQKLENQMQTTPSVGVETDGPTPLSGQPVQAATATDDLCEAASAAAGRDISPSLYNTDLAPTKRQGRRWTAYSIFTLWANDVHSLGNYAFAVGLFSLASAAGRSWWPWASARRCSSCCSASPVSWDRKPVSRFPS